MSSPHSNSLSVMKLTVNGYDLLCGRLFLTGGVTLVVWIRPTLIKDHLDQSRRIGVETPALDSTQSTDIMPETCKKARANVLFMFCITPKRVLMDNPAATFLATKVRIVVVPHAVCVSLWNPSFRPQDLKVTKAVEELILCEYVCISRGYRVDIQSGVRCLGLLYTLATLT